MVMEIKKIKNPIEANVISCLWKNPDLYSEYTSLIRENFSSASWQLYFQIGKECVDEGCKVLDEFTVGIYLNKHPKMNANYDRFGGYDLIDEGQEYIVLENFEGYVNELFKWNTILSLVERGFLTEELFKTVKDKSLEDLYDFYEAHINHIFVNSDNTVKSYNACEGLLEIIDECDAGKEVGLPIPAPLLSNQLGGLKKGGQLYLLGAQSGVGKTTVTIELCLSSILKHDERCVIFINEQDEKKIKKELITWIANNHFKKNFQKKRFNEGKFSTEEKEVLTESVKYMESLKQRNNITIIPLATYTVEIAKKLIYKYSAMGVKYFFLDTFKESADARSDDAWKTMMRDMRSLYDTVKPANKNVFLWCTMQLTKTNNRYLTSASIGLAKNMPDVADVCLLMRPVYPDEKQGGRREIKVARQEGKTHIPVPLDPNKNYYVIFVEKNRNGEAKGRQLVYMNDLSRNILTEVGFCWIDPDF